MTENCNLKNLLSYLAHHHQVTSRNLLILFAILVVSFFMSNRKFQFRYEEGKLWRYETLYAPFSFALQKSNVELEAQKKELTDNFIPYYKWNEDIRIESLKTFNAELEKKMGLESQNKTNSNYDLNRYKSTGEAILNNIYDRGIIKKEEVDYGKSFPNNLYILKKNVSELAKFEDFLTTKAVLQYLLEKIKDYPQLNPELLLAALQHGITPNITFSEDTSNKLLKDALDNILSTKGVIEEGQLIIQQGSIITDEKYQILYSMQKAYERDENSPNRHYLNKVGSLIVNALIFISFYLFLRYFQPEIVNSNRRFSFIIFSILIYVIITRLLSNKDNLYLLYAIPFCLQLIINFNFFGIRVAWMSFTITLLLVSIFIPVSFDFIVVQFLAGLVTIVTGRKTYYGKQFFINAFFVFLVYFISMMGFTLMGAGNISRIELPLGTALLFNSFLILLAYPIIPFFEKIFGFVSNLSLVEISDLNKPLLKELAQKAPGTFWHSLQVASLAESVADELGASPVLVKVGALYHDIGKMQNPGWFIENQKGGVNLHSDIDPKQSAAIIIAHVSHGIELAKANKLPAPIIDFIRTHHGTAKLTQFISKAEEMAQGEKLDLRYFTYPGPLPFSKETAILMMADSLEAATHSLKNPDEEQINNLVDEVIESKIKQHQFDRSDLTFKDLQTAKVIFKKLLVSKFHTRVSYPSEMKIS